MLGIDAHLMPAKKNFEPVFEGTDDFQDAEAIADGYPTPTMKFIVDSEMID